MPPPALRASTWTLRCAPAALACCPRTRRTMQCTCCAYVPVTRSRSSTVAAESTRLASRPSSACASASTCWRITPSSASEKEGSWSASSAGNEGNRQAGEPDCLHRSRPYQPANDAVMHRGELLRKLQVPVMRHRQGPGGKPHPRVPVFHPVFGCHEHLAASHPCLRLPE